ncbi:hypothetical protein GLOTRDRAFT_93796 [Gloeophyllum trabeum ATCC 11539]|uniref:Uncharacterized protein n=1 Tax=Gloeophyllum trabeum (strain ATCC 11539 / FP-39264 / Madison 617) TaxID=670483 RepID=S7Q7A0_GLOTA|nr:uncharacterized protein GLOTRDRAFT_93796 [Gloeophyllum trabeum ATCC 11539]EPQ55323.1 hypothetical protein GLOTRDRAFT_93796 [Gloeophyllum trabeum ATCC 11539]
MTLLILSSSPFAPGRGAATTPVFQPPSTSPLITLTSRHDIQGSAIQRIRSFDTYPSGWEDESRDLDIRMNGSDAHRRQASSRVTLFASFRIEMASFVDFPNVSTRTSKGGERPGEPMHKITSPRTVTGIALDTEAVTQSHNTRNSRSKSIDTHSCSAALISGYVERCHRCEQQERNNRGILTGSRDQIEVCISLRERGGNRDAQDRWCGTGWGAPTDGTIQPVVPGSALLVKTREEPLRGAVGTEVMPESATGWFIEQGQALRRMPV